MHLVSITITDNGEHWEKKIRILGIPVYHRHDYTKEPQRRAVGFQVFESNLVEVVDEDYYPEECKTKKKKQ